MRLLLFILLPRDIQDVSACDAICLRAPALIMACNCKQFPREAYQRTKRRSRSAVARPHGVLRLRGMRLSSARQSSGTSARHALHSLTPPLSMTSLIKLQCHILPPLFYFLSPFEVQTCLCKGRGCRRPAPRREHGLKILRRFL